MSRLTTEGVQVGESSDACLERVKNAANIYTGRKDCQEIKQKLMQMLGEQFQQYWNTLACFLHGQCSKQSFDETMRRVLETTELKLIHNELIRYIIYNAHFAMSPPPELQLSKPELPQHVKKPIPASAEMHNATFMTFSASDLRHIPSLSQLHKRMGVLLSSKKMGLESKAVNLLFHCLKRYVQMLLEGSVELLSVRRHEEDGSLKIMPAHVMHVLHTRTELAGSGLSQAVVTKYSNAMP